MSSNEDLNMMLHSLATSTLMHFHFKAYKCKTFTTFTLWCFRTPNRDLQALLTLLFMPAAIVQLHSAFCHAAAAYIRRRQTPARSCPV